MRQVNQIPKVIHYCWFGGNPLPELAEKCIASWKKYCPDYEIVEWNESNYDINACAYTREAYQAQKWAFVSDYARFDILYHYGGVYFDTDVELLRPLDDILEKGAFFGIEQNGDNTMVAPGLGMAAPAGLALYEHILASYSQAHFICPDGSYNQTTVVKYTTDILRERGLGVSEDAQCIDGIWIYPWDYFCPMKYETGAITITDNTYSIHHYSASWFSKEELAAYHFSLKASKLFGQKVGKALGRLHSLPYRVKKKIKQKGFWGAARFALQKIANRGRKS